MRLRDCGRREVGGVRASETQSNLRRARERPRAGVRVRGGSRSLRFTSDEGGATEVGTRYDPRARVLAAGSRCDVGIRQRVGYPALKHGADDGGGFS